MPGKGAVESNLREGLCFCEYIDVNGQRNHLLATCCACEALDAACDRCVTCRQIPDETLQRLSSTVEDRCRIPWIGGALRLNLEIVMPATLILCCVIIATGGPFWTIIAFTSMCFSLLLYFRCWMTRMGRRRTRFFFVFTVTSLFQLYLTYVSVVVGFREVFLWETLLLSSLFVLTVFFLIRTRFTLDGVLEEGGVGKMHADYLKKRREDEPIILDHNVTWVDSRPIVNGRLVTWCDECNTHQPPRSSHCYLCGMCVRGRDHHCVWLDVCIGDSNHRDFLLTLVLMVVTGLYGAHLTMTTICTPEMYLDWFLLPSDCRFIYADFPTALSFVSACCVYAGVLFVAMVLLQQIVLVSQNVTLVEVRRAYARGWISNKWLPWFVSRRHNVNNRGYYQNWLDLMSGCRRQRYLMLTSSV